MHQEEQARQILEATFMSMQEATKRFISASEERIEAQQTLQSMVQSVRQGVVCGDSITKSHKILPAMRMLTEV